ncbi:hypothetical protein [Actinopolymorpha sp. B9G3]|uniref:hypothetical protein n=1 Tax=Actinopolymorpha sp. B9G3 TaxID=3158970 RepID=UPI0032D99868
MVLRFVAYYGRYEIRILRQGAAADPIVNATDNLQRWASNGLDRLGAPTIAVTLGLLLLLVAIPPLVRRRTRNTPPGEVPGHPSGPCRSGINRGEDRGLGVGLVFVCGSLSEAVGPRGSSLDDGVLELQRLERS